MAISASFYIDTILERIPGRGKYLLVCESEKDGVKATSIVSSTRLDMEDIESLMKDKPEYTFFGGKEQKFMEFFNDYVKTLDSLGNGKYAKVLELSWRNSRDKLNASELWRYFDKTLNVYDKKLPNQILLEILGRLSPDEFKKGFSESDDQYRIYSFFNAYSMCHRESEYQAAYEYADYMKTVLEENTKDEKKTKMIKAGISNVFLDWFSILDEKTERNRKYNRGTVVSVCTALLPLVDLDFESNRTKLRDIVGYYTAKVYEPDIKEFEKFIKLFIKLSAANMYIYNVSSVNIIELCALIGDIDKIREVLSQDDIILYPPEDYGRLKNGEVYPVWDFNDKLDYITNRVPNERFCHKELLELLTNDKVKMLNGHIVSAIIERKLLDSEEVKTLLDHIQENDVVVYCYSKGNVMAVEDIYQYLMNAVTIK